MLIDNKKEYNLLKNFNKYLKKYCVFIFYL